MPALPFVNEVSVTAGKLPFVVSSCWSPGGMYNPFSVTSLARRLTASWGTSSAMASIDRFSEHDNSSRSRTGLIVRVLRSAHKLHVRGTQQVKGGLDIGKPKQT